MTRLYEAATGDSALYEQSYTYRLRWNGWSDAYHWATLFTWIANDVGFPATILVMGVTAWVWGCAWHDVIANDNFPALIVFCMLTQALVYIPANNQLMLVTESYVALLIWLAIWWWSRNGRSPKAKARPA